MLNIIRDIIKLVKKMNSEIYNLLKAYHNKELDDIFINKAFDIMMKYEKIDNYVNNFNIVEENDSILGTYSNERHDINFNKQGVLNNELISNKKLLSLQVLRHELEHAKNLKRIYEKYNDIKTRVIRYSLLEHAINNNIYYGSSLDKIDPLKLRARQFVTYDIDPGERMADINSWKFMVNLLKNQRFTEDLLNVRSMLYYSFIRGYKNNGYYLEPPTYEYLLTLGLFHEHYLLKKDFNKNSYNLDTRLLCGLPISQDEYNNKILQKVKLQKKKRV